MWRYYIISPHESSFVTFSGVNMVCSVPRIRSCKQKKKTVGEMSAVGGIFVSCYQFYVYAWTCVCGRFSSGSNVFSLHTAKGMVSPPLWTIKIPSQLIRSVPLCFTVNVSVQLIVECLPMTNIKTRDSGRFQICFSLGVDQVKSSLFFSAINHCRRGLKVTEIQPGAFPGWSCFLKWSRERNQCTPCLFSH